MEKIVKGKAMSLKEWLKANGITQREFAGAIDLDGSVLSRIISGEVRPSMDSAYRIERVTAGAIPMQYWVRDA